MDEEMDPENNIMELPGRTEGSDIQEVNEAADSTQHEQISERTQTPTDNYSPGGVTPSSPSQSPAVTQSPAVNESSTTQHQSLPPENQPTADLSISQSSARHSQISQSPVGLPPLHEATPANHSSLVLSPVQESPAVNQSVPGLPPFSQLSAEHTPNSQPSTGHPPNRQSSPDHLPNSQSSPGHPPNNQSSAGHPPNSQSSAGHPSNNQSSAGHPSNNQPSIKLIPEKIQIQLPMLSLGSSSPDGDNNRLRSESDPRPPLDDVTGVGVRGRNRSGTVNPPGVRGIIIGSRSSRENSPYRSPHRSPAYLSDRAFILPASGATPTMPVNSVSDYSIFSGGEVSGPTDSTETGTRPKTTPRPTSGPATPRTHGASERCSPTARRHSDTRTSGSQQLLRMPTGQSLSAELVMEQSEEVMQNFMFERYNRDSVRTSEDSSATGLPRSPELIENFSQRPQTNVSAIGRRLATIGDEIDARYSKEFTEMTRTLNITQGATEHAYSAFRGVAMRLFQQGSMSVGKIIALLQFGYHLAMDVLRQGIGDFMSDIIKWLIKFISVEKIKTAVSHTYQSIAEWLASHGGWQAAVDGVAEHITADSTLYVAAFVGVCASLVGIAYLLRNR